MLSSLTVAPFLRQWYFKHPWKNAPRKHCWGQALLSRRSPCTRQRKYHAVSSLIHRTNNSLRTFRIACLASEIRRRNQDTTRKDSTISTSFWKGLFLNPREKWQNSLNRSVSCTSTPSVNANPILPNPFSDSPILTLIILIYIASFCSCDCIALCACVCIFRYLHIFPFFLINAFFYMDIFVNAILC